MVLPVPNPTKSYWIEAAESPLRNYRSSEQLQEQTDIAIIGSGYAGASTAYWIHKCTEERSRQPQVTILEARDICGSATGRNGGQLRPHAYSRYPIWRERFGPDGAMKLIVHEMAHLQAFKELAEEEGITEEVCLKFGETFDAAMTDEAWARLKGALDAMRDDHGEDDDVVKVCRAIEDAAQAEEFTQMKGALAAVVHPSGQIWAYKFVHALLRILLRANNLSIQANTPVTNVSERDADGWMHVTTTRGTIRARTVVHTTNRWASHLLPELEKLILPARASVNAIKAPPGFIKHTGAQHWDSTVNNYHLQLPEPYNTIILGGARPIIIHTPDSVMMNDEEDKQFVGVPEFCESWPASDIKDWPGPITAELGKPADQGGCWTGIETSSADGFPFVGPVPGREGQFINAGFSGHGMPRILLSSAHIAPLILDAIGFEHSQARLAESYPALPLPFHVTADRIDKLQATDLNAVKNAFKERCEASAKKPCCDAGRAYISPTPSLPSMQM
ncbi:FAD dependent oxidoreductase-domain-containing protein [Paraphoma chrysanthemicola]|uniref:FAD dependent oxidoreductase-domain-containing protein n=1 Tax=Paraphoma chrysanthemicola TaxID=798071 RepID=A0A8K0RFP5_9PLEO|nr:FAD dependent oxidoreductase-domain-containing protein [Paraphoma chrysanthemicola]